MLAMIREDATIDENAEAANAGMKIPGKGQEEGSASVRQTMAEAKRMTTSEAVCVWLRCNLKMVHLLSLIQ